MSYCSNYPRRDFSYIMETEIPVSLAHAKTKKLMESELEGQHSKGSPEKRLQGFSE